MPYTVYVCFFQAEDGIRVVAVTGVQTCVLPICAALWACQPADVCLVDGFKLGPTAPEHRAVVDGDEKSAAIAAASIVAKVTRDRYMHSAVVRAIGPSEIHRRSFEARCYAEQAAA